MTDGENKIVTDGKTPETMENLNNINEAPITSAQDGSTSTIPNNEYQKSPDFTNLFSEDISNQETTIPENVNNSTETTKYDIPEETTTILTGTNNAEYQATTTSTENQTTNGNSQPVVLNNQQPSELHQETGNNNSQKEKLLQLIKTHESNAQRKGFTIGILSGVGLTACILGLSIIFAKDQIINILNNGIGNNTTITASVLDLENENNLSDNNTPDENIVENYEEEFLTEENEITYPEDSNENDNTTNNITENNYEEYVPENELQEINDETTVTEDEMENEEKLPETENTNDTEDEIIEINDDNNLVDKIEINEDITQSNETEENTNSEVENEILDQNDSKTNSEGYRITRVSSTGEANWVLPAICGNDIFCNNPNKTFIPCEKFRLNENLSDDANRIGNTGTCRYKDPYELVHIDFE